VTTGKHAHPRQVTDIQACQTKQSRPPVTDGQAIPPTKTRKITRKSTKLDGDWMKKPEFQMPNTVLLRLTLRGSRIR
jgi:hypothetical protein